MTDKERFGMMGCLIMTDETDYNITWYCGWTE